MRDDRAMGDRGIGDLADELALAADAFGTPAYVIVAESVRRAAARLESVFGRPWVRQYSLKANDLPAVVAILATTGWGANVVSAGEWQHASSAGVPNGAITFEGIGKVDAELQRAVAACAAGDGPKWLSIESPEEAEALAGMAAAAGLGSQSRPRLDVLLRLNPGVQPETTPEFAVGSPSSKFGMSAAEIRALVRGGLDRGGLRVRGIHLHVGSDLRDVAAWAAAGAGAVALLGEVAEQLERPDTVDFGGGFPLPGPDSPQPERFLAALLAALDASGLALPARPAIEPGRYLVGAGGWLVSRVLHSRDRTQAGRQVVLDAGMTELIRPALYGSRHPLYALADAHGAAPGRPTAVEGPICESTDSFGVHALPSLRRGDLVAFAEVGAYGAAFTSRYNGRPEPIEVLLADDGSQEVCERPAVIRPRRAAVAAPVAAVGPS